MRIVDYLTKKIIALAGGISKYNGKEDEDRLVLVNDKRKIMENKIREGFGFEGTSIKFVFREKGEKEE